jgi:UDP-N-acetylmuramate dehydrogenase
MERDVHKVSQEDGGVRADDGGGRIDADAVVQEGGHDPLPGGGERDSDGEGLLEELDLFALNPRLRARLERQSEDERRMSREVRDELAALLPEGRVRFDEPMSAHCASGAGGPAEAFVSVGDAAELTRVIGWACERGVDYRFVGAGSSILVRDGGLSGLAIRLGDGFAAASVERSSEPEVIVSAGGALMMGDLAAFCREQGLAVPWMAADPRGTLGGALCSGVPDPGLSLSDSVVEATIITKDGRELTLTRSALRFEEGSLRVPRTASVTRAVLRFERSSSPAGAGGAAITSPAIGPVFRSPCRTAPEGLIEDANLKGVRIGGARVSPSSPNFMVNEKCATARDFAVLIGLVRERVNEECGVQLASLVEIVGKR